MGELRVVVIDDNEYERWGLAQRLDEQDEIAVVRQLSQDEAETKSDDWFGEFDVALVEVIDEFARGEIEILLVRPGPAQHHLLVVTSLSSFVHAHAGLRRVVEAPLPTSWPIMRHWRFT